jgi:hypothetical protein
MHGIDFQEKLLIKFQEENVYFIALISIHFQEKLHIKFQEQNINFHSIDRYWLQEKLYIKFQKGNINFTSLMSNEFKRNLVLYFKMKTLIEFLNKYPSTPQSQKLFARSLGCMFLNNLHVLQVNLQIARFKKMQSIKVLGILMS